MFTTMVEAADSASNVKRVSTREIAAGITFRPEAFWITSFQTTSRWCMHLNSVTAGSRIMSPIWVALIAGVLTGPPELCRDMFPVAAGITGSGAFVSVGLRARPDRRMWRLWNITEGVLATMLQRAVHPGDVLRDELEERGVSPASFAKQIDVPPNRISQILAGKRAVTGDSALRFGHWFGMDPQFWLNLQAQYELAVAERMVGAKIRALPTAAGGE